MATLKLSFITAFAFFISCCGTKERSVQSNTNEEITVMAHEKKMIEDGFMKGTIVYSEKENDCPYTIRVEADEPYFLDPINLDRAYKSDGAKVWFTFTPLRRMNRCEKANPVNITEMEKRGE